MFAPSFSTLLKGRKGGFPKHTPWDPKIKYFEGKSPQNLTKEFVQAISERNVCIKFDENR